MVYEKVNARNVEELPFVSILDEKLHAKIVEEVLAPYHHTIMLALSLCYFSTPYE